MPVRRTLDTVVVVALVIVAGLGLHRVFEGWSFAIQMGAAAIVAAAVVTLVGISQAPRGVVIPATIVGLLGFESYVVLGDTLRFGLPRGATVSRFFDGIFGGWADALDDFLPLDDSSSVMVLLVALAWLASAVGVWIAQNTDRVVPPVIPGVVLFALSLPLAAPTPVFGLVLITGLAALVLLVVLARANPSRQEDGALVVRADDDFQPRRSVRSVLITGIPMLVLASVLGATLSGAASFGRDDNPYDPRESRAENIDQEVLVNPLAEFNAIKEQVPLPAFTLALLGTDDFDLITRVPIVALDRYDGAQWTTDATYRRVGTDLPVDDELSASGVPITQSYTYQNLRGPWLPVASRPIQIDVAGARFDDTGGTLLTPLGQSVTGLVAVSQIVQVDDALIGAATPAVGEEFSRYTALPGAVDPEIARLASEVTAGADTPFERLRRLELFLRSEYILNPEVPAGHSLGRINGFLFDGDRGTAEQFATAFAVMARSQGFPTRIVVGYDLSTAVIDEQTNTAQVLSSDIDVWAEVRFEGGLGWFAYDPTPLEAGIIPDIDEVPGTTVPQGANSGSRSQPSQADPGDLPPDEILDNEPLPSWLVPLLVLAFVGLWVGLFAILIVIAKRRRRSLRRQHTEAAARIEGAWRDSTERLVESGISVESSMTMSEIIDLSDAEFGNTVADPLRALVPDVARSVYGADPPSVEQADRAWLHADEFRSELSGSRSKPKGAVALLNPRPLLRARDDG